ncbi:MAG: HAD hydrolase-like protein [Leptospirales bacterium]|nr:HAD hydrolase-like protein [Leptospirales bacterium]
MNKNGKTYLAFDIDGTIYDAAPIVVDAFRNGIIRSGEALGRKDILPPEKEAIVNLLGTPTDKIFGTFFPGLSPEERGVINDACNDSFVNLISGGGGRLMDGAYDVLENFYKEGYIILPASNGRKEYVTTILKSCKIEKFFGAPMHFVEGDIRDKSAILPLYKKRLLPRDILIMIGDREADRVAASINNVPFIGCAFGHAGDSEIRGERWIASYFRDIPRLVNEIEGSLA